MAKSRNNFSISGDQTTSEVCHNTSPRLNTGGDSFNRPIRLMELKRKDLAEPLTITFEKKYGHWFWTGHSRHPDLSNLKAWGDTLIAIERMCRRLHFRWRWAKKRDLKALKRGIDHAYWSES
jgi:hypothetical protein